MTSTLSLAYSPCPNDTFIFGAWAQGLLNHAPPVEVTLEDIETLNQAALRGDSALTKVSYGAIAGALPHYRILRAGGALGRGCGPLVVSGAAHPERLSDLSPEAIIAIPGEMTTAFLLLQLALGRRPNVVTMRFDTIVDAVASGSVDAGLIIHESRFTYQNAGLTLMSDLGAWWEELNGLPIPLGGILIRRDLGSQLPEQINATIRASLQFAYDHPAAIAPYIRAHACEIDKEVMQHHIDLYVNPFTMTLGPEGEAAVIELFERAYLAGLIPSRILPEFV